MTDHLADVRRHSPAADETAVAAIVKHLGVALHDADAALVAATHPAELATVRDAFAVKVLGLSPDAADAAIAQVMAMLQGVARKSRVTVYYLLAEATGTLDRLR